MRNRSTQEPEDDRSPYRGPSSYRSYNNGYGQSNRGDYSDYSSPNRRSYSSYSGPRNSAPRYSGSSRFDVLLTSGSRDYNSYNRDAPVNSLGFHGDTRPSPSLERELFDDSKHVTEGINFDKYEDIPVEVGGHDIPEPIYEFDPQIVPASLMKNVELCNFKKPTPVQKYGMAIGLAGRDLMACAQTGSGKTAGFLFPLIMLMLKTGPRKIEYSGRRKYYPTTLILAPTRELAVQIYEEARKFAYCTGIACCVCYGGVSMIETTNQLMKGCDILVGTPGRLVDLIERGKISFQAIKYLVLDEADRMLDMGFEPQIRKLVLESDMPLDRQTMMFSATFPVEIQKLAMDFLKDYIFLTVGRVGAAAKDITQKLLYVHEEEKQDYLLKNLVSLGEGKFLIFVATKRMADRLEDILYDHEFPVCSIHGDKTQREREYALEQFKAKKNFILVATDVAARGLDIPEVTYVINYDTPSNIDDYVHRIGRTGRAGNTGVAISYINEENRNIAKDLYDLLHEANQEIPSFLEAMCSNHRYDSGYRGGRGRFGGKDYRHGTSKQTHILNKSGYRNHYGGGSAVERLRNNSAAETTDAW